MEARPIGQLDFRGLLDRHIEETGEGALGEAYEQGGLALQRGASFLDLLGAFGDALLSRLATDSTADATTVVRAALDVFAEVAVPFQVTSEGYRSAISEFLRVNQGLKLAKEALEERVRGRTAELEAAKGVAETASQAKSEFLSRMSHELRTPLNAVLGFAQLLSLEDLTPGQRDAVADILRAGRHLVDLVNEVLDLARIEAGRLAVRVEPVRLRDVVTECLALLSPAAAQHDVFLQVAPVSDGEQHVLADRQRLTQVVINLVTNAVKYNRPGGDVTIGWGLRPSGDVRFVVGDTGLGIAEPLLARLFQPFERLEAKPSIEGTGLGLALSRRLVEAMGGEIGVESEPDRGTTFWVDLPAGSPSPASVADPVPADQVQTYLPAPVEVLYVEDDPSNARVVEQVLRRLPGLVFLAVGKGNTAVDLAIRRQPGLILLDMHLPDMSGEEVLARLRSHPRTAAIPVIGVSADATPGRRESLLAAGAAEYLTKPLNIPAFLATVVDLLALATPPPAPGASGGREDPPAEVELP